MDTEESFACHKACKKSSQKDCELTTISASQFSTFLIFCIYIGYQLSFFIINTRQPDDVRSAIDSIIRISVFCTYLISIFYYFMGCWATEEEMIDDLRKLNWIVFYSQWVTRIAILAILGLFTTITNSFLGTYKLNHEISLSEAQTLAYIKYLLLLFGAFILWDLIVWFGGQKVLVKPYLRLDFVGLLLLLISKYIMIGKFYTVYPFLIIVVLSFSWIIFGYSLLKEIKQFKPLQTFKRILKINQVR